MDKINLADRACDCARLPLLSPEECTALQSQLPLWHVVESDPARLSRLIKTNEFKDALALACQIGELAESINHHPDLTVSYGSLLVRVHTHSKKGLTEADFILAAKIDRLLEKTG